MTGYPQDRPMLHVGTRRSPLALVQTRSVIARLADAQPDLRDRLAEHPLQTTGDAVQDRRLAEIGGKGLFAKEIHEALLDRRIDLAVHSLKDLETSLPDGVVLACVLPREDARDVLVLPGGGAPDLSTPYASLAHRAVIGTSSLRRQAQLLHARPDLRVELLRGNLQTRMAKLDSGQYDATLLAMAGLRRMGLATAASVVLDPEVMLPAAAQGIIGVTARADDAAVLEALALIEDAAARAAATAERALLGGLDGSCRTPIGGHARLLADGSLHLTGLVARPDGTFLRRGERTGPVAQAAAMGLALADELRAASPADIFA